MTTTEHAVVIAGGGPTGTMLAAELALGGVEAVVVERRPDRSLEGSRAGGLHVRTLELLDQRGIVDRFLDAGTTHAAMPFGTTTLAMDDLPTRHPYFLALWQARIEGLLADRLDELGVRTWHGRTVEAVTPGDEHVEVRLDDGRVLRAGRLVGCDGGRSVVRRAAGIGFPGWEATRSTLIAELGLTGEPPLGLRHDATGVHAIGPLEGGRGYRVVVTEAEVRTGAEPTLDDLRARMAEVLGGDHGAHDPTWISRFTDATRQAERFVAGRVLLAGDAAHVHYPVGGQGLSLGIQDAVNLGWKLALVVRGNAPEALLDSYHDERHPAVARTLRHTLALGALQRRDDRTEILAELVSELAGMDEPRRRLVARTSGLDVRHDLGDDHPLLGRRMPDVDLTTADGPRRAYELLHDARPLLLDLDGPDGAVAAATRADPRVRTVAATAAGPWELPALGEVPAPAAVLVRPDGHVAWVGDAPGATLDAALERWLGAPRAR